MPHRAVVAVLVTVLAMSMSLAACNTSGASPRPAAIAVGLSAAVLASGRWSTIPPAPIARRDRPSVAWTGRELLVWGGTGSHNRPLGDGAAYDPATHRWRVLAPAPLSPRSEQTAVWTGHELVIWGGDDFSVPKTPHVFADGAVYRPDTDTWRRLPPAPLSERAGAVGTWTGSRVVILGGGSSTGSFGEGASYDPRRNRWSHIAAPVAPPGHAIGWGPVVAANGEVLAWSNWGLPDGPAGADLFALDERTDRWRFLGASGPAALVEEAVWTGHDAIVRGRSSNCGCVVPDVRAAYDPVRNIWRRLPANTLEGGALASVWTGSALVAFDASPPDLLGVRPGPAHASAYDPRTAAWTRLPDAPGPCGWYAGPFWTGRGLIVFCSVTWLDPGPHPAYNGLAFDATARD